MDIYGNASCNVEGNTVHTIYKVNRSNLLVGDKIDVVN
jgi:hypothetical protein